MSFSIWYSPSRPLARPLKQSRSRPSPGRARPRTSCTAVSSRGETIVVNAPSPPAMAPASTILLPRRIRLSSPSRAWFCGLLLGVTLVFVANIGKSTAFKEILCKSFGFNGLYGAGAREAPNDGDRHSGGYDGEEGSRRDGHSMHNRGQEVTRKGRIRDQSGRAGAPPPSDERRPSKTGDGPPLDLRNGPSDIIR